MGGLWGCLRSPQRSRVGLRVQGPGLPLLCLPNEAPPRPFRIRAEAWARPHRVCLLVPKSTSCRRPHVPMAPCRSQQAALNPAGPRQAVTSRPLGPLKADPSPWGSRVGVTGQVSLGRPCRLDPPAPATGPLHPEWGPGGPGTREEALRLRGTPWGSQALGTTSSPPPLPLTSKGGEGRSPAASRRLGGRGCLCASWAPRASNVVPTLPVPTPVLRGGLGAAGALSAVEEGLLQPRLSETSVLNLMNSRKVKGGSKTEEGGGFREAASAAAAGQGHRLVPEAEQPGAPMESN